MEKEKKRYGHRWMAEQPSLHSKRMFGEYVVATRFQNMVKEMMIKVSLYNLFTIRYILVGAILLTIILE